MQRPSTNLGHEDIVGLAESFLRLVGDDDGPSQWALGRVGTDFSITEEGVGTPLTPGAYGVGVSHLAAGQRVVLFYPTPNAIPIVMAVVNPETGFGGGGSGDLPTPGGPTYRGVDAAGSANAIDRITADWFSKFHTDYGPQLYIQQLYTHIDGAVAEAERNLGLAHDAGWKIAGYFTGSGNAAAAIAAAGVMLDDLVFIAPDIEDGQTVSAATITVLTDAGVQPVIYTAQGPWAQIMGNSTEFSNIPLWDARWDNTNLGATRWPDTLDAQPFVPYGGWTARVGWQFKADYVYVGIHADLDAFSKEWLESVA